MLADTVMIHRRLPCSPVIKVRKRTRKYSNALSRFSSGIK